VTVRRATLAVVTEGHWVGTWAAMPQLTEPDNLPPAPYTGPDRVLADATLRQTVHVSLGGTRLRLRLSNEFGGAPLPITAAAVAGPAGGRAGVSGIDADTSRPVTFAGRTSVVVPVGARVVSDPVAFDLPARSNLAVTLYLADGIASTDVTSHPGSRTTSHLSVGDHVRVAELPGATPTDHWYLLSGVEVWADTAAAGVVVLGDSLTDGRSSTTNGNDRWPDRLLRRLHAEAATAAVAVLNIAGGGNRVLTDGLGPGALARFDRDVLGQSAVAWLMIFHGINDIGTADATVAAQTRVADDLIAAYEWMIARAHAHGIAVYGATLLPFGGNAYDDARGRREAARQRVNGWIRAGGRFDAVVDLDRVVGDPDAPRRLRGDLHDGDHLHLNPTGYALLGDAVPVDLFRGTVNRYR
jgi:lysophospholipase L1-like esterase